MMQQTLVSPYTMNVPKLDISVTSARPLGSDDSDALELMPIAYQRLCGSVAIVLSSGAEVPAKKYSAAYAPKTAEIVASVQIARWGVRLLPCSNPKCSGTSSSRPIAKG